MQKLTLEAHISDMAMVTILFLVYKGIYWRCWRWGAHIGVEEIQWFIELVMSFGEWFFFLSFLSFCVFIFILSFRFLFWSYKTPRLFSATLM